MTSSVSSVGCWKRHLWSLILSAVFFFLGWLALRRPEPDYGGKPLSYWTEQFFRTKTSSPVENPMISYGSDFALRQLGTNAIPYLLELMTAHVSGPERALSRSPLPNYFSRLRRICDRWELEADEGPQKALLCFELLGPKAAPAVPSLIHILRTTDNPKALESAVYALWFIGPAAKEALPDLVLILRDSHARATASYALLGIGFDSGVPPHWRPECSKLVVPNFVQLLREGCEVEFVLEMFCQMGPEARSAVPELIKFLNDTNLETRFAASKALSQIDREAAAKVVFTTKPQ